MDELLATLVQLSEGRSLSEAQAEATFRTVLSEPGTAGYLGLVGLSARLARVQDTARAGDAASAAEAVAALEGDAAAVLPVLESLAGTG